MRILLFLISYGIAVISCSHLVLFLNFLSLGYSLNSVLMYMLQSKEFIMLMWIVFSFNAYRLLPRPIAASILANVAFANAFAFSAP